VDSGDLLERGQRAFEGHAWPEAYDQLTAADRASPLPPEDLERAATAAYLAGHDRPSAELWSRAHQTHLDRGEFEQAVRCAFWLGFGLVQRGEMAQGGGWLARAQRLVDQHALDCVERGYLLLPEALMAAGSGHPEAALACFEQIGAVAGRFGDADLAALAKTGQGEALLRLGRAVEGARLFDEAMVAVTTGETSPVVSGVVYCAVIDACQKALDLRRAEEWTEALDRWCREQPGLVPYRGQCLVHRSQVLQVRGDWGAALREAEQARARLTDPPHPAVGMAHYQLGELHRLRGEHAAAEAAYREAHAAGRPPQPGLALLRLAQGRLDAAVAAIEAAVADAHDHLAQAQLLPAQVEIMLAAGRPVDARAAAEGLDRLAGGIDTPLVRAIAAQARGTVLLAEGDPAAALEALAASRRAWQELGAPHETAQVRILMAAACGAVGDHDTADLECAAARAALEALGAAPALARLDQVVAGVGPGDESGPDRGSPMTARETEVLRLVAAGHTNREIAEALVISEKTVERHLSNIFTKLGVANRAAATAYAYDHHLV
jgi:DNA-binding NarL/FixJ family response regulator